MFQWSSRLNALGLMFVGLLSMICQGWWLFRLGSAIDCANTTVSGVLGIINYLPGSTKLRVPKDCIWTIVPPKEDDFLLIINLKYLSNYDNDDDFLLPDRTSMKRQEISHTDEPQCHKYVVSGREVQPCLQELNKRYCTGNALKDLKNPIRISISSLPLFEKFEASYLYTNFQASFLFVFCEDKVATADAEVNNGIGLQFESQLETTNDSSSAITSVFSIFVVIFIIIIILLCLKIRSDKKKQSQQKSSIPSSHSPSEGVVVTVHEPGVEASHVKEVKGKWKEFKPSPMDGEMFQKKERELNWVEILAMESHSDPACNEIPKNTKRGSSDVRCTDVLMNSRNKKRRLPQSSLSSPSQPCTPHQTPQAFSRESLDLPAIYRHHVLEESAAPQDSFLTTTDRRRFKDTDTDSSCLSLISDIHPTYRMRTIRITHPRPSPSDMVYDETYREIHAAMESICNTEDMETASRIGSSIPADNKCPSKKGVCGIGENLSQVSGAVLCLTAYMIMCIMQMSKKLENFGNSKKLAFDPMKMCHRIQMAKAKTSDQSSYSRLVEKEREMPSEGVVGSSSSRMQERPPKIPNSKGEGSSSVEQVNCVKMPPSELHSNSGRSSAYGKSKTEQISEPSTSLASEPISESYVTKVDVKGIMKKKSSQKTFDKARKKSNLAKFLDQTSWPKVFSSKRVNMDP